MRRLLFGLAVLAATTIAGCGGAKSKDAQVPDGGGNSVCGNGATEGTEQCDDGSTAPGDGCSATCTVEPGWECPSGGACTVKPGWVCPFGSACRAAECGDGIVAGDETCDDGNTASGDGCSSACQVEPQDEDGNGWLCTPGQPCVKTVCGDGSPEGNEQCDDGNGRPFDGCYECRKEPVCVSGGVYGACQAVCGDAIVSPGEDCDDGNVRSGDGCSAQCEPEDVPGISCTTVTDELPHSIDVPVVYRDFKGYGETGGHPDFEHFHCDSPSTGLVQTSLDPNGKPVFAKNTSSVPGCGHDGTGDGLMLTSIPTNDADFREWYVDTTGVNKTVVGTLHLTRIAGTDSYEYDSEATPIPAGSGGFFPLDGNPGGFGLTSGQSHDFHFTTEIRYAFTFQGNEVLTFSGDDDVWVFINGKLALDLGGLHPRREGRTTLAADGTSTSVITLGDGSIDSAGTSKRQMGTVNLGLVPGEVYEISLFHAERHTQASNFWLTLGGFVKATTVCESSCGDGIKSPDEECDLGCNGHRKAPDEVCDSSQSNCDDGCTCTTHCKRGIVPPR